MSEATRQTGHGTDEQAAAFRGVIAIVDDDPDISSALAGWLTLMGHDAVFYPSGESLLQVLSVNDGRLSVSARGAGLPPLPLLGAVVDLNLPGITGVGLARSLRRMAPQLPLAIITALHEDERASYDVPPEGIRCLRKPFDLDVLEDALFPLAK